MEHDLVTEDWDTIGVCHTREEGESIIETSLIKKESDVYRIYCVSAFGYLADLLFEDAEQEEYLKDWRN